MRRQLTFDLPARPALGRDEFFVSPANAMAVTTIENWTRWPQGKLALVGPKGSGKTHLAHVWASEAGGRVIAAADLEAADIAALGAGGARLAVEDVDRIAGNAAAEQALFHLHNLVLAEAGLLSGLDATTHWAYCDTLQQRFPDVRVHPRRTLVDLLGVAEIDAEDARRARLMATEGMVARLDFALSALPEVAGLSAADLGQRLVIAPDMNVIETAFNAAKYRELPARPVLECSFEGGERPRLSVSAQFVPCTLKSGWTGAGRDRLTKAVRGVLEDAMPGIGARITAAEVATPADIEARFGLPGGHWHHGELRVDQMLMLRPFGGAAQYRMPVAGLYLCGAGAHPGGDISGAPGWNAAGQALKDGRAAK